MKSRELVSGAVCDVVASSNCPEQPAVDSDAYAAADQHQEEGEHLTSCSLFFFF